MKEKNVSKSLGRSCPRIAFFWRILRILFSQKSYLHTTGWMKSLWQGRPVNKAGVEIPWMNHTIIELLESRLNRDLQLFEFGSGYSTSFYARLVEEVTSLEYDKEWLERVKRIVPGNVTLIYVEADVDGKYCRAALNTNRNYDVIIIDGRDRVNCIKQSIAALTDRGILLLDDSSRNRYQDGIKYAMGKGFRVLEVEGLKPTSYEVHRSTLLYRSDNCLGI